MRGLSSLLLSLKRASGDSFSVRSVTNVRVLGFGTVSVVPLGLAAGTMRRLVLHVVPDPDLFVSESLEEDVGHLSVRIPTHTLLLLSLLQPRWQGPLLTPGLLLAIVIMCRCPIMGYLLLLFHNRGTKRPAPHTSSRRPKPKPKARCTGNDALAAITRLRVARDNPL